MKGCPDVTICVRPGRGSDFRRSMEEAAGIDVRSYDEIQASVPADVFVGMHLSARCTVVLRPVDSSCLVVVANVDPKSPHRGESGRATIWARNAVVIPPMHLFGFTPVGVDATARRDVDVYVERKDEGGTMAFVDPASVASVRVDLDGRRATCMVEPCTSLTSDADDDIGRYADGQEG